MAFVVWCGWACCERLCALGGVSLLRESLQGLKKRRRLAGEETACGQRGDRVGSDGVYVTGRANHGAERQVWADELARHGEDQVGLKERVIQVVKIRESQTIAFDRRLGIGKGVRRTLHGVAREVDPFEKVGDFVAADAEDDFQDFETRRFLSERGVEASATLLDGAEMKSGAVGYDLNVIGVVEIAIVARDERAIDDGKRLLKRGAEIGIICAAVANEPAGVHSILEQVCEAADLFGSGGFAAGQSAELVEVNRLGAL